jgi:hypothetical protein
VCVVFALSASSGMASLFVHTTLIGSCKATIPVCLVLLFKQSIELENGDVAAPKNPPVIAIHILRSCVCSSLLCSGARQREIDQRFQHASPETTSATVSLSTSLGIQSSCRCTPCVTLLCRSIIVHHQRQVWSIYSQITPYLVVMQSLYCSIMGTQCGVGTQGRGSRNIYHCWDSRS